MHIQTTNLSCDFVHVGGVMDKLNIAIAMLVLVFKIVKILYIVYNLYYCFATRKRCLMFIVFIIIIGLKKFWWTFKYTNLVIYQMFNVLQMEIFRALLRAFYILRFCYHIRIKHEKYRGKILCFGTIFLQQSCRKCKTVIFRSNLVLNVWVGPL